jgi:uncharacterized membrane protein YfcA
VRGNRARLAAIFAVACGVGVMSGLLGLGGGFLLVPLLVLLFHFDQHRAQGTTLVALVPPTGLLAFLNYAHASRVDWRVGLLLMPGVLVGGFAGARLAQNISPRLMRRIFALLLFSVGAVQVFLAWRK